MKCSIFFKKKEPDIIIDVLQIKSGVWYKATSHRFKEFLFCRINDTSCFVVFNDGSFGSHRVNSSIFTDNFKAQVVNSVEITVS